MTHLAQAALFRLVTDKTSCEARQGLNKGKVVFTISVNSHFKPSTIKLDNSGYPTIETGKFDLLVVSNIVLYLLKIKNLIRSKNQTNSFQIRKI